MVRVSGGGILPLWSRPPRPVAGAWIRDRSGVPSRLCGGVFRSQQTGLVTARDGVRQRPGAQLDLGPVEQPPRGRWLHRQQHGDARIDAAAGQQAQREQFMLGQRYPSVQSWLLWECGDRSAGSFTSPVPVPRSRFAPLPPLTAELRLGLIRKRSAEAGPSDAPPPGRKTLPEPPVDHCNQRRPNSR